MKEGILRGFQRDRLGAVIKEIKMKNYTKARITYSSILIMVVITVFKLSYFIELVHFTQKLSNDECWRRPKYKIISETANIHFSYLTHLHRVLGRVGYEKDSDTAEWDLLWAQGPHNFSQFISKKLWPHQKVNQIPGTAHMKAKGKLALFNSKYIPKAFVLPSQKIDFLDYAEKNKDSLFLQKNVNHRGIRLISANDVHMLSKEFFIQEYIQDPLLVDGYKFDIGVYVVITSMKPLRAYWYQGDVGFRYCTSKYKPFDPMDVSKYVIADDYMPTWNVPSLAESYISLGHGMKNSFEIYMKSRGIKTYEIWLQIEKAISEVLLLNGKFIRKAAKKYSQDNFFELVRFDFIVNRKLQVYVLEVNLSPNLSSSRFPLNAILFEQLLYNLFLLTGIVSKTSAYDNMVSSEQHIAVSGENCRTVCLHNCEASIICKLCIPCLDNKLRKSLLKAHSEFLHRGDFRRVLPSPEYSIPLSHLTPMDRLQYLWYKEKCRQDVTWCT